MGAEVVDSVHDETGFDAGDVHGVEPGRLQAPGLAGPVHGVVDRFGVVARNPDLVAEVARVAGARQPDVNVRQPAADDREEAQCVDVGVDDRAQDLSCVRSLEGERAVEIARVLQLDVEAPA